MKLMNFLKKNKTVVIALVVLSVLGYYLLVVRESFNTKKPEPQQESSSSRKLIFFHMNGCPHCTNIEPEWEKIVEECKNKNLQCEDYEASAEGSAELHKLHEVREVCDKINILRAGMIVGEADPKTDANKDRHKYSALGKDNVKKF